jgi:Ca2+-binding RTX toxin-like protein
MATLTITADRDFSDLPLPLLGINAITFSTTGTAIGTFDADQFGTVTFLGFPRPGISNSVAITGDANLNVVSVLMSHAGSFSAAGWRFTNWDPFTDQIHLSGTAGNDTIIGSSQADSIFSRGGVDHLFGGDADDTFFYITDPRGSVDGGAGADKILLQAANVDYDFANLSIANVERLDFFGVNTTAHLTGDQLGAGPGAMTQVQTHNPGGHLIVTDDAVDLSSVGFTLFHPLSITINGQQNTANVLVGSSQADVMRGGALADTLSGGGGDDQLTGGAGADVLDGGAGQNAARYDASAGAINVNLATGTASGGDAQGDTLVNIQNVVGTAFADVLTGNGSANSLFGGGGNDILVGGAGSDLFVFNTALDAVNNIDALSDFQAGVDQILLDDAVFAGLAAGVLAATAFVTGTAAAEADDRIVYDQANGLLFFDPDGNGTAAAVHFANVQANVPLTHTDFVVV